MPSVSFLIPDLRNSIFESSEHARTNPSHGDGSSCCPHCGRRSSTTWHPKTMRPLDPCPRPHCGQLLRARSTQGEREGDCAARSSSQCMAVPASTSIAASGRRPESDALGASHSHAIDRRRPEAFTQTSPFRDRHDRSSIGPRSPRSCSNCFMPPPDTPPRACDNRAPDAIARGCRIGSSAPAPRSHAQSRCSP